MRRWRPRTEPAPVLWQCFCEKWLQISPRMTAGWWQAVQRSRWTRATALRSMVLCQAAVASEWQQIERAYQTALAPEALMAGIEDLVTERRLTRRDAVALEEAIFQRTGTDGHWKEV